MHKKIVDCYYDYMSEVLCIIYDDRSEKNVDFTPEGMNDSDFQKLCYDIISGKEKPWWD